ncbi:O-antigen ligase family protein [Azonexus sp.]|uniref:O-antigen ligase family protein n=1 Tax=Azonexus sp. TaxID=1872668 RepID=UPI0035B327B2
MRLGYDKVRKTLYAAALVIPFTELRFGFVGAGEILLALALLMLLHLNGGNIRRSPTLSPLVSFWYAYLVLISIGFVYNLVILGYSSGTYFGAAFDFLAYLVILGTLLMLGDERLYQGSSPREFFETVFLIWGIVFSILYLLSFQTSQIFGLPLRYYNYFSPLVENVHQAAMITSAMPFIMWYFALNHGSWLRRTFYLIVGGLFVLMALESGATKAFMAVVVGSVMSVSFLVFHKITLGSNRLLQVSVFGLLASAGLVAAIENFDMISSFAIRFFQENDGSSARENLYTLGLEHGMQSFLVGYGPGPHIQLIQADFSDAHNTVLTIFLQGGIVGILLLLIAIYRLVFLRVSTEPWLLGSLSAISMYLLGGDILRRLPIWLVIVGILHLSREKHRRPVTRPVRKITPLLADSSARFRPSGS